MTAVLQSSLFEKTLDQRFAEFHQANPHVYARLVEMARALKNRGHRRVGIKMLFEVIRWEELIVTDDPSSEFNLNNSYSSRYARLVMAENPDLAGLFETRAIRS